MTQKRFKEKKEHTEEIRLNKFLSDAGYCSRRGRYSARNI